MSEAIGIVGAGLFGRTLAVEALRRGYRVELFDRDTLPGMRSCGYTGAGMLSPYSELELAEQVVFQLGHDAIAGWRKIIAQIGRPVFLQDRGTIAVAHPQDGVLLQRFAQRIQAKLAGSRATDKDRLPNFADGLRWLSPAELASAEPALAARFDSAVFLAAEGQIDNRQLMGALADYLRHHPQVIWHQAAAVEPDRNCVRFEHGAVVRFDLVIDCRGLGAKHALPALRGVRGEILELAAPEVRLSRPIRMMHPRYPLYIVPRENGRYLVGATSIESDDERSITVRSTLELLSAAYSVDPAFAEAEVIEARVNHRPALPSNLPQITHQPGLAGINGLYRHGFLLAPKLAELVLDYAGGAEVPARWRELFCEEGEQDCQEGEPFRQEGELCESY